MFSNMATLLAHLKALKGRSTDKSQSSEDEESDIEVDKEAAGNTDIVKEESSVVFMSSF